jgi:DtxR family Mn-dependent transcriptional regulator
LNVIPDKFVVRGADEAPFFAARESAMFWKHTHRKKVFFEDALKHIYDYESRRLDASSLSLSGILRLRTKKVIGLVEEMEEHGLIKIAGHALHLTPQGRAWALQVIRAHRLWESYLSEEVGLPLEKIHKAAEKKEHDITPSEADRLDARLGYPARDPHGDPIPSVTHKMEQLKGVPLTDWPIGKMGRILHVEDEPQEIYAQILSEGFFPDEDIEVAESGERGFHILSRACDCWLPAIVVGNIQVGEIPQSKEVLGDALTVLRQGKSGKILALKIQGMMRIRFLDMGILPGATIEAVMPSVFGEPWAYKVKETLFALRREQAEQIIIQSIR